MAFVRPHLELAIRLGHGRGHRRPAPVLDTYERTFDGPAGRVLDDPNNPSSTAPQRHLHALTARQQLPGPGDQQRTMTLRRAGELPALPPDQLEPIDMATRICRLTALRLDPAPRAQQTDHGPSDRLPQLIDNRDRHIAPLGPLGSLARARMPHKR
ncbi:hypothetical protein DB30_02959 [Enhygromyxa salina]|uniref:Uncharacterized protein n=1 Tax=Enhygromyxa salina TaxID=215803 RepID=A0A0C1ZJN1_9BACT|nr:hypothetical protein DB30_02959 [Enhygromyxa salina]